jgi:hypothetical protein
VAENEPLRRIYTITKRHSSPKSVTYRGPTRPIHNKARRNPLPGARNPPAFDVDHAGWVTDNTRLRAYLSRLRV